MVDQVRVLLFDLPALLQGILSNSLRGDEGLVVLARAGGFEQLPEAARQTRADVVIASDLGLAEQPMAIEMAEENPRIKIFNIRCDGRQTLLCQLHPQSRDLGQMAPPDLAWQIHDAAEAPFQFWHSAADLGTPS